MESKVLNVLKLYHALDSKKSIQIAIGTIIVWNTVS